MDDNTPKIVIGLYGGLMIYRRRKSRGIIVCALIVTVIVLTLL
jgi:hypothetical protein